MPFSEIAKIGPPTSDELEFTIFGPSFGECVVVHFGSNRWFIVDCCVYPGIDGPVAAHYLKRLGLDVGAVVESIVVTHWHDDHCKGISKLVEQCSRAAIWIPSTLTDIEFVRFVKRFSKNKTLAGGVKTKEFSAILDELHRRKNAGNPNFGLASQRMTMHQSKGGQLAHGADFKLIALSPSHGDGLDFLARVARQMPRAKRPKGSLGSPSPNEISVASLMEVGDAAVLLGADLENSKPSSGWDAVLNANRLSAFGAKAAVYKIPHHGSNTAHNLNVWAEMLEDSPTAVLTPWTLAGGRLPRPEGIKAITALTPNAFASAPDATSRSRKRHASVQTFLRANNIRVRSLSGPSGFVRLRKRGTQDWSVELFGAACRLDELIRRRRSTRSA